MTRILITLLLLFAGCSIATTTNTDRNPLAIEQFSIELLDDETISSSALPAPCTVIHFWATWCLPCIEELQMLQNLEYAVGADRLKVIAISLDRDMELLLSFLAAHKELTLLFASDASQQLKERFDIYSVPVTIFMDKKGAPILVPIPNTSTRESRFIGIQKWDHPEIVRFFKERLGK